MILSVRCAAFAKRNLIEIARDRLTLFFGVLFPMAVLSLMSLIGRSVPGGIFPIGQLAPGICVFGLSFLSLFGGMLTAKDRSGAFMVRLLASPVSGLELTAGYLLPLLPVGFVQSLACLLFSGLFGLKIGFGTVLAAVLLLPMALFYTCLGLLLGSVLTEKQVGGVCGSLVTNLSAWLSGAWFDPALVGGAFRRIADFFPFIHASRAAEYALKLDLTPIGPHFAVTVLWSAAMLALSAAAARRKMRSL